MSNSTAAAPGAAGADDAVSAAPQDPQMQSDLEQPVKPLDASISIMLWFRAAPDDGDAVMDGLQRVAATLNTSGIAARVGHRHEEDRPYRTWMIDVGPVESAIGIDATIWRLQKALRAAGLERLCIGEPNTECFQWRDAREGKPPCA